MTKPASPVAILCGILYAFSQGSVSKDVSIDSIEPTPSVHTQLKQIPLQSRQSESSDKLFEKLSSLQSGIDLVHQFPETAPSSFLNDQCAAGGICIGDYDGDGLPDIYFTNYDKGGRLYRNLGNWRFADVTAAAGVAGNGSWCAGPCFVDIDNDSDLDLAVSVFNGPNLLFINQGNGEFAECAKTFGLDFNGASVMMAFADYDRDGDLDGYLVTHRLNIDSSTHLPKSSREIFRRNIIKVDEQRNVTVNPRFRDKFGIMQKGGGRIELITAGQKDHLYRNNGNGTFTDVSETSGISGYDIGLAATWWDYNNDDFPDLYVSNDYRGPDRLYRNNQDGSFEDVTAQVLPHVPWSSMGADVGDINNDGLMDFLVADMLGTNHHRRNITLGNAVQDRWFLAIAKPQQYRRSAVYLNSGTSRMMEVAWLTGLAATDWTWSPRFEDLNNDGRLDLFIANGMSRDFMDLDRLSASGQGRQSNLKRSAILKEPNLAFKNMGDLDFERVEKNWGLDQVSASFGAAFGDFDRDGDQDLIVTNFDELVSVYRNNSKSGHRVMIRLRGKKSNAFGLDAKITLKTKSNTQTRTLTSSRGFMSSSDSVIHFGLGEENVIQELHVRWPSGRVQKFEKLEADQKYTITEPEIRSRAPELLVDSSKWFMPGDTFDEFRHRETPFDDEQLQPLLPWKLSQLGPGIAIGDVNRDGIEDIYLGGASGSSGKLGLQVEKGRFVTGASSVSKTDNNSEDMAALFFEADGDGDLDLYVVSGGVEHPSNSDEYSDRLYFNDGKGSFKKALSDRLPGIQASGSIVAAADIDRDGDLDLFIGGRLIPGQYPLSPRSRLLINESGYFRDRTDQLAPGLATTGMVTSALWSDADQDGWIDLLVAHEWGPVKLYQNANGTFTDNSVNAGLAERAGFWNGITGRDLDGDGDIDYAVTNLGLNTKYRATPQDPIVGFYGDVTGLGKDFFIECYFEGGKLLPGYEFDLLKQSLPMLADRFQNYHGYASASVSELFSRRQLMTAHRVRATTLESGLLINDGNATFKFRALPRLAQISPGFGVCATEVNGDGFPDLFIVQNFESPRLETGRMSGGLGLILKGNSKGTFSPVWPNESGIEVEGDARSLVTTDLNHDGWPDFVVGQNNGSLLAFQNQGSERNRLMNIELEGSAGNPTAVGSRVTVVLSDRSNQTAEVYSGGGYLSQCTPTLTFGLGHSNTVVNATVWWPDGSVATYEDLPNEGSCILRQSKGRN